MEKLKLLFSIAIFTGLVFTACDEDDPILAFDKPIVSAPVDVQNISYGAGTQSVDFSVSIDAGLTATYSATGVSVTVLNSSGSINGSTITINYEAGANPGAASITLTVIDSEGQVDEATVVINIDQPEFEVHVTSNIAEDVTWTSDKVYILGGRITVINGVTLTIEPGTIIKGEAGTGANASALLIARGGKIFAEGTAGKPIIFTSVADEILPEDIEAGIFNSPNLDPDINGLWGGLLVLGKAPVSVSNESGDVTEIQIEGIPTSDQNGLYGGNDPGDNSGILKYISIRHGGANIGAGNEINGLTLGGVGSETIVENIEIVSNQDDGIEWFGGTVNVTNAVIWNVGDDAIDTDQSWAGTLNNFIIISPDDHNFELDGPEGSYKAGHIIQNGTVIANDPAFGRTSSDLINTDDNSIVELKNIYFTSIKEGQKINRVTFNVGVVTFEGIQLDVPEADLPDYVNGEVPEGVSSVSTPTVGADISLFGWTWAAKSGKLSF
ncbi:MAG: hypothetical protein PHN68_06935 [Prolixibacteraceae bacterium]|nr:hypothetical protein [Prolixibacteraceae bacterium]